MIVPDLEDLISETEQECAQVQREEAEKHERKRKRAEDSMKRREKNGALPTASDWSRYAPTFGSSLVSLTPRSLITGTLTTKRLPKA